MKRFVTLLCVLLPLMMLGCSAGKAEPEGVLVEGAAQPVAEESFNTIYGKVERIVGNEVVLALGKPQRSTASSMEAPEGQNMPEGQMPPAGGAPQGAVPEGTFAAGERSGGAKRPFGGGQPMSGGQMPAGENNARSVQAFGNPSGMGRSVSLEYTGETATYLLPVGMAIGSGDFSNVSEGMVLALSMNEEGVITAVRILSD